MNLKEEILAEHSKRQTDKIATFIGNDPVRFSELIDLFFHGGYRVTQRSAWVVSTCVAKYPLMIEPYLEKLILNLNNPVHDAVKRNSLKILEKIEIPDQFMGLVADICFNFLSKHIEPVAIKALSMSILYKISKVEPELVNELRIIIEDQLPYGSAGFRSRGGKILKLLEKR